VILVKPKLPYIEWANSLDDNGPKLDIEKPYDEYTIYLVDEIGYKGDIENVLKKLYAKIFEYELFMHLKLINLPDNNSLKRTPVVAANTSFGNSRRRLAQSR
jgi:hypothetical protein